MQRINALYHVEATIRGHAPDQRRIVRQNQSKPIVDDLRAWLDAQLAKVPRRARIAEAIRYALKLWSGRRLFLDDGRIEIGISLKKATRIKFFNTITPAATIMPVIKKPDKVKNRFAPKVPAPMGTNALRVLPPKCSTRTALMAKARRPSSAQAHSEDSA